MTAPTTAAGQTFDTEWPGSHIDRLGWQKRILAIEAEAREQGAQAERARVLKAVDRLMGPSDADFLRRAILDAPAAEAQP